MTTGASFAAWLALTVVLLGGVVLSGLRARRRIHLPLVAAALASLGVTIFHAKELGALYDLESAGAITPVHLALAKLTTACYLLPVASGILTLRNPARRAWHRRAAILVLSLTVVTLATGTWMILAAAPR